MDQASRKQLETLLTEKICGVCIDRNPDGSCDRRAEGSCTLMEKIPEVADAILKVSSNRMDPYIESIRENVCRQCDLRNEDGTCDWRETDQCMLDSYLSLVVESIEEFHRRSLVQVEKPQ